MLLITNYNFKPKSSVSQVKVAQRPSFAMQNQPTRDQITFGNEQVKLQRKLQAALIKANKAYPPSTTVTNITSITLLQKKLGGLKTEPVEALLAKTQEYYDGKTLEGLAVFSKKGTLLGDIYHLDAEEWIGYEAEKKWDPNPDRFREGKYLRLHNLNATYTDKYKGIGTALIQAAIEESKKLGFEGQLKVNAENYCAPGRGCPIPFYAKMGFIPCHKPDMTKEEMIAEYSKPKNVSAVMKMFLLTPERKEKLLSSLKKN